MLTHKIQVLVVDDSAFMRKIISELLTEDPEIEVIGTARNGADSLKKIEELKPDVVTMDIEMPVLDGISTLREIMERFPLPVIMLSSLTQEGAKETIKALELGAVDFISKPSGTISLDIHKVKDELLEKVKIAARCKGKIMANQSQEKALDHQSKSALPVREWHASHKSAQLQTIIAIGTSTGGPRALQNVLIGIPKDIPAPIVIVQHMPQGFTKSLAERLDSLCEIRVVEAVDQMPLEKGVAYIAPGGNQMGVVEDGGKYHLHIDKQAEPVSGHKPSVDYLFHSVAALSIPKKIIVIMTGMGGDGSKGLIAIKQKEAYAIAEAESTCVVFGMPKVAIQTGKVDKVLPVDQIAAQIVNYVHL